MPPVSEKNPESTKISQMLRKHNVTIVGEGNKTIIFGHGFGCDQQIWQQVAPAFIAGYKVVLFDYMGCGKSDLSAYNAEHYNHLQAYADDLIALCTTLQLDGSYFVGHSVSGSIAMLAAIQKPQLFKKIIAIGPSPHYLNEPPHYHGGFSKDDIAAMLEMMDRNYFEWTDYLAPLVIGSSDNTNNINELKQTFLRADPIISKKFAVVTFYSDIRQQLKFVPVPVTILYCLEDVIVPLDVIHFLQQHIPQCKISELDATGHYPQLINPQVVINAIQQDINSDC